MYIKPNRVRFCPFLVKGSTPDGVAVEFAARGGGGRTAASRALVQRRHASPERFDVLPDLCVVLAVVFVERGGSGQLEIGLQIPQRARKILEIVGEQSAISQLVDGRRIDGTQQFGDVERLRKRAHLHV